MKHSLTTNVVSFILMITTIVLFSHALNDGFNFIYAIASLMCLIGLCAYLYNAKLILVFTNGRFVKNV